MRIIDFAFYEHHQSDKLYTLSEILRLTRNQAQEHYEYSKTVNILSLLSKSTVSDNIGDLVPPVAVF